MKKFLIDNGSNIVILVGLGGLITALLCLVALLTYCALQAPFWIALGLLGFLYGGLTYVAAFVVYNVFDLN